MTTKRKEVRRNRERRAAKRERLPFEYDYLVRTLEALLQRAREKAAT